MTEKTATSQAPVVNDAPAADPAPQAATTMRAAVLADAGRVELRTVARPMPGPGQVRIRLEGCGVCASNIPAFEGRDWFAYPLPPGDLGHEGWGVVDAVGEDVTNVAPGDRVAALSFNAYAEYDLADADALVTLPPELDGRPFPGEALGCVMNIYRRAAIEPGHTVAIVGAGFLGAALTRLASQAGARVIAISRSPSSLQLAEAMGAAETVPMDDHGRILETVGQLTGGRFCERVIEATGKQWPIDLAGELTGFGGRLAIAGFHQDGPRSINLQLWNWRGIDVANAHERDRNVCVQGMRDAVDAVVDGRLDPDALLTHSYPLEELGEALEAARTRPDGFTKAWVRLDREGTA